MRRLTVCALVLGLPAVFYAQEKPVLRAELNPVETPAPPPPLKVALTGKALENYQQARSTALEHLASPKCSQFLKAHWFEAQQVSRTLQLQQPQDGAACEITLWTAGAAPLSDPDGGAPVSTAFKDPKFLTMAISQANGED